MADNHPHEKQEKQEKQEKNEKNEKNEKQEQETTGPAPAIANQNGGRWTLLDVLIRVVFVLVNVALILKAWPVLRNYWEEFQNPNHLHMTYPICFGDGSTVDAPSLSIAQSDYLGSEDNRPLQRKIDLRGSVVFLALTPSASASASAPAPASASATDRPHIDIHIWSSEPKTVNVDVLWDQQRQWLHVSPFDDNPTEGKTDPLPKLRVHVAVYAPQNATLKKLQVDTTYFDVTFLSHFPLHAGETVLRSETGTVYSLLGVGDKHYKDPTEDDATTDKLDVRTVSGQIQGNWNVIHSAKLQTDTGNVVADLHRARGIPGQGANASIQTTSGKIDVGTTRKIAHPHDAFSHVNFTTVSGKIDARMAYSQHLAAKTVSGDINLDLKVIRSDDSDKKKDKVELITDSQSGSSVVNVRAVEGKREEDEEDNKDKEYSKPVDWLTSLHTSVSGAISLFYPKTWEGRIDMSSSVMLSRDRIGQMPPGSSLLGQIRRHQGSKHLYNAVRGKQDGSVLQGHVFDGEIKFGFPSP